MDEYIKREDALDALMFELAGSGYQSRARDVIRLLPTADVALRAEVAREIFDKIENLLSANMSGELRGDSIEWFDYFDLHLAEDIAELKNEYTEAEPPKGDCYDTN